MAPHIVPVRELNQNTSAILARVQTGEELVITVNGTPVARLVPFTPAEAFLKQLIAEGRAVSATNRTRFAQPPTTGDPAVSVADAMIAERYDEDAR